ncbi:hypothetical protein BOTBODRAFT_32502 [Botryobasidium botryosum FD-172 SS1]|uniref:Uncharacterized protein n=1 Tax=Botryobasidium botryosum (strain FD-172 SS1) TaxID=930990 RepID=A0A067MG12_BOTB1|nr:hypothetical protein BOTBODRAFT_32502 [Botryobasidium botryosum FD-172 SS1]
MLLSALSTPSLSFSSLAAPLLHSHLECTMISIPIPEIHLPLPGERSRAKKPKNPSPPANPNVARRRGRSRRPITPALSPELLCAHAFGPISGHSTSRAPYNCTTVLSNMPPSYSKPSKVITFPPTPAPSPPPRLRRELAHEIEAPLLSPPSRSIPAPTALPPQLSLSQLMAPPYPRQSAAEREAEATRKQQEEEAREMKLMHERWDECAQESSEGEDNDEFS